jgi:hypothetical protein
VFGSVLDSTDQAVVDSIVVGDIISGIVITGAEDLLENQAQRVSEWNSVLGD